MEALSDTETLIEYTITNIGTIPTGELTVTLPLYSSQIGTTTPTIIPSLVPGQSYTITLVISTISSK